MATIRNVDRLMGKDPVTAVAALVAEVRCLPRRLERLYTDPKSIWNGVLRVDTCAQALECIRRYKHKPGRPIDSVVARVASYVDMLFWAYPRLTGVDITEIIYDDPLSVAVNDRVVIPRNANDDNVLTLGLIDLWRRNDTRGVLNGVNGYLRRYPDDNAVLINSLHDAASRLEIAKRTAIFDPKDSGCVGV